MATRDSKNSIRFAMFACGFSATLHAAVILILSLCVLARPAATGDAITLVAVSDDLADWEVSAVDPRRFALLTTPDAEPVLAALNFDPATFETLATRYVGEAIVPTLDKAREVPVAEGASGEPLAEHGGAARLAEHSTADFFGAAAPGESFVFLLDTSGSMADGARYRRAFDELERTIGRLDPRQRFFVILFSTESRAMLDLSPSQAEMMEASEENKARLRAWLATIAPVGWTDPRPALDLAHALRPDAIFLLSDGEFKIGPPDKRIGALVLRRLRVLGLRKKIPVHAVAFEDAANGRTLRAAAEQTGGSYRFVPVKGDETSRRWD